MLTQLRFLLGFAYGLKLLDQRRFEWCVRELDEVGRVVKNL